MGHIHKKLLLEEKHGVTLTGAKRVLSMLFSAIPSCNACLQIHSLLILVLVLGLLITMVSCQALNFHSDTLAFSVFAGNSQNASHMSFNKFTNTEQFWENWTKW